jgi:hypothetical protein
LTKPASEIISGKLRRSASCKPWEHTGFWVSGKGLKVFSTISPPPCVIFTGRPQKRHLSPDFWTFPWPAGKPWIKRDRVPFGGECNPNLRRWLLGPVVAYSKKQGSIEISHYIVLHEPGAFELIVPKGDYYLFAFRDANRNLKPEAAEPAGQYVSPTSITASGDGVISDLDFVLSNSGATPLGIAVGAGISGLHSSPGV